MSANPQKLDLFTRCLVAGIVGLFQVMIVYFLYNMYSAEYPALESHLHPSKTSIMLTSALMLVPFFYLVKGQLGLLKGETH